MKIKLVKVENKNGSHARNSVQTLGNCLAVSRKGGSLKSGCESHVLPSMTHQ